MFPLHPPPSCVFNPLHFALQLSLMNFMLLFLHQPQGQAVCGEADKQEAGDRQSDRGLRCQTESCTEQPTVRQRGGQTGGTADRLAVGVSPLTRPDSFHAGSCSSEREDRLRFRLFDVGVALAFEGTAHSASVCFCCISLSELAGAGPALGRAFQ